MTHTGPEMLDFVVSVHVEDTGSSFRIGTTRKKELVVIGLWRGDHPNGTVALGHWQIFTT